MPWLIESKRWGNTLYLTGCGGWTGSPYNAARHPLKESAEKELVEACKIENIPVSECYVAEHLFTM